MTLKHSAVLVALIALSLPTGVSAKQSSPHQQPAADAGSAPADARPGPAVITLADGQAQLNLPSGLVFIGPKTSSRLLHDTSKLSHLQGVVYDPDSSWLAVIRQNTEGHVDESDAQDLNADDLLTSLKDGAEKRNKEERIPAGEPALHVLGWTRPPFYDASRHMLSCTFVVQPEKSVPILNCTALLFGRRGYVTCTVVGAQSKGAQLQASLDRLCPMLQYLPGEDYSSYRDGDQRSNATMAGLIAGGAYGAAKLGIFGKFGKLILVVALALKKFLFLAFLAGVGFFRRLFGSKKAGEPAAAPAANAAPPTSSSGVPAALPGELPGWAPPGHSAVSIPGPTTPAAADPDGPGVGV